MISKNMKLKFLKLQNFRNHQNFQHKFNKNITVFYGSNAIGKTNIIEAIRFLSLPKSFRAKLEHELINWGYDFARAEGSFEKGKETTEVEIYLSKSKGQKKVIKINNNIRQISDLVGQFFIVLFCPEDLNLISEAPSERRKYLNIVISQADKRYYQEISELKKILLNRNKLLFDIKERGSDPIMLEFWNEKLISLSKNIFRKRSYLINFINKKLPIFVSQIGLRGKKLEIKYKSKLKKINLENFEEEFRKQLKEIQQDEIRRTRTLIGPHRDDFEILLDNKNVAYFASRGETRGIILALKLAELSFSREIFKIKPILLLDDIFSELDFEHRRNIVKIARDQQTIITTTELELVGKDLVQEAEVVKINSDCPKTME